MKDEPEEDGTDKSPDSSERQMLGVVEILQSVEDALVAEGWEDFRVRTQRGLWIWRPRKDETGR